jgi:hypothetical protein
MMSDDDLNHGDTSFYMLLYPATIKRKGARLYYEFVKRQARGPEESPELASNIKTYGLALVNTITRIRYS